MSNNYRHLNDDDLIELIAQYRQNLKNLEIQAAKFGSLHQPTPNASELRDTRATLDAFIAEQRRRAAGTAPDPPALTETRQRIAQYEAELQHARTNGETAIAQRYERRLDELRTEEARLLRERDNYAEAYREREAQIATDIQRERVALHDAAERRQQMRREQVVNRRFQVIHDLFRDRVDEMNALQTHLNTAGVRLVAVVGVGGMGKTALVSRVCGAIERNGLRTHADGTPFDGIVYRSAGMGITLENLYSDVARLLEPDARQQLLARQQRGGNVADLARALWDALADTRALLVLDNLETVLDADGVPLDAGIAALLTTAIQCDHRATVLLTTRRAFQVHDQRRLRTVKLRDGLPPTDGAQLLRDLDPDNEAGLHEAPQATLEAVSERLRGVPRLLESFAALLYNDPTNTAEQLLNDQAAMTDITAALHDGLDSGERLVLLALAVYGEPVLTAAVEYLLLPFAPALDVRHTLGRLARMAVLTANRNDGTYTLHPLDREQALASLPPRIELPALHRRAAEYYAQLELPAERWRTIDDLAPQLARFSHLCAAAAYDDAARLLRVIDFDYLQLWGHAARIIALREPLVGRLTDPYLQMSNANNIGLCYNGVGRVREAITCYEGGLRLAQRQGSKSGQGAFLGCLGNAYAAVGEPRRAIDLYEQQLVIVREIDDRRGEGTALGNLGLAYAALGEPRRAIDLYEQWLAIAREIGNRRGEGNALGSLGLAYSALGEIRRAIELYEQQLVIVREIGDRRGEGNALGSLGLAYAALGEPRRAIDLYEQWLAIAREIGNRRGEGNALGSLGLAYSALGEIRRAIELYEQQLVIVREIGDRRGEGIVSINKANAAYWLGDLALVQSLFEDAFAIHTEVGSIEGQSYALIGLGDVARARGQVVQAGEHYAAALALDVPRTAGRAAWRCGVAAALLGQQDAAVQHWQAARQHCEKMNEDIEYRYLGAMAGLALATLDRNDAGAAALAELQTAIDTFAGPLLAAECVRDIREVEQALGIVEPSPLHAGLAVLEPLEARLERD